MINKTLLLGFFVAAMLCEVGLQAQDTLRQAPIDTTTSIGAKRRNAVYFTDGLRERLAGNDQKALRSYEKALQLDPDDHASMYELSELYARQGRIDEARSQMQKAVQLNPDNDWYQIRLAQIYKYEGNYAAYGEIYRKLLQKHPGDTDYFGELSSALLLQEKYDEALAVFNEIENQIGVNEMISLQKQQIYNTIGKPKKAIEEIEKLAAAYPYEVRYQAMLAELYMNSGSKQKALAAYQNIVALDPEDPYVHISLSDYYRQQGDLDNAYNELKLAFQNPELDIETKIQVLSIWFGGKQLTTDLAEKAGELGRILIKAHPDSPYGYQLLGDMLQNKEDLAGARSAFESALSIDSSNYAVWESLLFVDINLSDFIQLENHAERALALFPEQPLPYLFSGLAKYQREANTDAMKRLETGRKLVVGNDRLLAEFYNYLGEVQDKLGNHAASDQAYDKALLINPDNSVVLNNYAYYLSLRGEQLEKALKMAAKAVELDPENASNIDTYAWVFYKLGRYEDALRWIEKALSMNESDNGTMLEHYGDILYKLGRKEDALANWNKAKTAGDVSELLDKKIKEGKLYE